jgi:hypothetical protein
VSSTKASVGFANAELVRSSSPAEMACLEHIAHPPRDDVGAAILMWGESRIAFFVASSGTVVDTRGGSDGHPREVRTISTPGSFAEMALFSFRPHARTGRGRANRLPGAASAGLAEHSTGRGI